MRHKDSDINRLKEIMSSKPDGSIPEIFIRFKDDDYAMKGVNYLILNSKLNLESTIYDSKSDKDIKLKFIPKNELYKRLENGHLVALHNLKSMPCLGVSIFKPMITLDFIPGKEWTKKAVCDLVNILSELKSKYYAVKITLDDDQLFFHDNNINNFNNIVKYL